MISHRMHRPSPISHGTEERIADPSFTLYIGSETFACIQPQVPNSSPEARCFYGVVGTEVEETQTWF